MERVQATAAQAKAVAHPVRLRILRLCHDQELTNRELADRLDRDPSTILHHTRLLVDAGLIEPAEERPGPRGSTEKPYRATGLSWRLDLSPTDKTSADLAALEAVGEEVREAGPDSIRGWSRLVLHLDDDEYDQFSRRIQTILDEFVDDDDDRRADGSPRTSVFLLAHHQPDRRPDA